MPRYDFHEVHSIVIRATPADVDIAIRAVTPAEMPLVGTLFALRALPNRLLGRGPGIRPAAGRPLLDQALQGGFVLLGETPQREIVLGTVGTFWSLRGGPSDRLASAHAFAAFVTPGYAKAAMNFFLEPLDGQSTRLRTETRIVATDPPSRRRFGRYWSVIHPGSALIRRMWLRAIKRRAETEVRRFMCTSSTRSSCSSSCSSR